jgi:hypothetical protein
MSRTGGIHHETIETIDDIVWKNSPAKHLIIRTDTNRFSFPTSQ